MRWVPMGLLALLSLSVAVNSDTSKAGPAPDKALKLLVAGNQRYVKARLQHPNQTSSRRVETAKAQHPFAVILSCADSRVPPEIVFDQGIGDLFVLRVAGNIDDDAITGSIEYGVAKLGARLIVVLGHERCGAVDAALKGGELPGHIGTLVEAIKPALKAASALPGDKLDNAVKENVKQTVSHLKSSEPMLAGMVKSGQVKVVGARYDLDTGVVTLVP
jgi:carbonic anhydrase